MARVDDISVEKWTETLTTVVKAGGGCYGVLAAAAMVRAMVVNTRTTLGTLPTDIVDVRRATWPILEDLSLLESRTESYMTRLADVEEPATPDDRIDCDRIYFWLMTGKTPDEPPLQPVLAQGDAILAVKLWNQTAQLAASEAEVHEGVPAPEGAVNYLRKLYSGIAHEFSDDTKGAPTARTQVVAALEEAARKAGEAIDKARGDVLDALKWSAVAAVVLLALYLYISSRKST